MLVFYLAFLTIIGCASSAPGRERKNFGPFDDFPGFGGAYAAAGFIRPFYMPSYPFFNPFAYVPVFAPQKPWYEGDNVCKEEKVLETPDEVKEWMGFDDPSFSYNHESETCRGNNNKYVCYKKYMSNDVMKFKLTKYECCLGFVRNPEGPGCVEKSGEEKSKKQNQQTLSQQGMTKMSDQMHYSYVQESSGRNNDKSEVGKVTLQ